MEKYLSHLSAAITWNIPCIETVLGYKITEDSPTHITVTEHSARVPQKGQKVHACEVPLPKGAVVVRNGRMVASPELLFLELASELSMHRLILLGLQLCSHPPGHPSKAITTKEKIESFLAKTTWHRGQRKAVRAIKYVENDSASIMESLVYMILTLPNNLGGFGLNGAVFNYEIEMNSEVRERLGKRRCFLDLYYKQAKLAVEYDSFAYHSSPSEQGNDGVRSAILERQGIKVMHMNTIQLYDSEACRDFAYNLKTSLGKRIQIRSKNFDEMHAHMRGLLPDGKSVPEPQNE